jgi:TatA/E family protein of Tat protein translocase
MGHIESMDTICASLGFIDGLGAPEMVLIFVLVLVLFGGQKLPEFARGLGKSMREFKKAAAGVEEEFKRALEEDERKHATPKIASPSTPALTEAAAVSVADPAGPEAGIPTYDEYGNEVLPETPPEPVPPVTPPASVTPADAPTLESTTPSTEEKPQPAAKVETPPPPAPPVPPPSPPGHPENP